MTNTYDTNIYDPDFEKRIIELIHGLPFEESKKIEEKLALNSLDDNSYEYLPITIGRVMQALNNKSNDSGYIDFELAGYEQVFLRFNPSGAIQVMCDDGELEVINWKLTKENGQECDHTDQSEETILKLTELLK